MEFCVGMIFDSREAVKIAAKEYSMRRNYECCSNETKKSTYTIVCVKRDEGCKWRLRATIKKSSTVWEITKYCGPHTCARLKKKQGHKNFDSQMISELVGALVKECPTVTVRGIVADMNSRFQRTPSYKKAWYAKNKVIANLYGDWDESYKYVRSWINVIRLRNPGSMIDIVDDELVENNRVVLRCRTLKKLFVAFRPCIKGFEYCQPVIFIDGTFLTGKYKGVLLTAEALDGNNHILPIAFGIVEKENNENWDDFMTFVRFKVCPGRKDICVVSDRHISIKNAMKQPAWRNVPHRYCECHVMSNYNTKHKNSTLKKVLEKVAYESQKRKCQKLINRVKRVDRPSYDWINLIPKKLWTRAFDGGPRYGHMTTNIAESVNAWLKDVRDLPITAMLDAIFYVVVDKFHKIRTKYLQQMASRKVYTKYATNILLHRGRRANGHRVLTFNDDELIFEITTAYNNQTKKGRNKQVVNLTKGTCVELWKP